LFELEVFRGLAGRFVLVVALALRERLADARVREADARPLLPVERRFLAAAPCCGRFLGAICGAFL
jgi:hypothetical protein